MILKFGHTPSVQVQVSRLKSVRWGSGVPRPRGESLPNTPTVEQPPLRWVWFGAIREDRKDVFLEMFEWKREEREPWEQNPDWWKQ